MMGDEFAAELKVLLNKHSIDSYAATPDYILAGYLVEMVETLRKTRYETARWEGHLREVHFG